MDEGGNIIVMRRTCRPGGYITVEASFVFPIIFFIDFIDGNRLITSYKPL